MQSLSPRETKSLAQDHTLSGWSEKKLQSTSQSQTCTPQKKGQGRCLVACCWSDPLQLCESWWTHYTWEACSANRWYAQKTTLPAAGTGQQKGSSSSPWPHPTAPHTTNTSEVERLGLQNFTSSAIFSWPLTNWLPLFQASWQLFAGKISTTSWMQEIFSKSLLNLEAWIFTQDLLLTGKTVLIITVLILINRKRCVWA